MFQPADSTRLRLESVHVARHDRLADTDSDSADLAVLPKSRFIMR